MNSDFKIIKSIDVDHKTNNVAIEYFTAPDGHDYILASTFGISSNAGTGVAIIHAVGCKKCEELKNNKVI